MSKILPTDCSVFIQVWVDSKSLQNGSSAAVYLVDNRLNNGSSGEATASLNTAANTSDKVCWSIVNTDVNSDVQLSFSNFGNSEVFGASGTPQPVNATTWTGQVQNNGNASYAITLNAQAPGGSGISTTVNPSFSVG